MAMFRGKILWVDDDKLALTPFYDELRDNEYDVEMVGSADKAIEILNQRASEFDLAILDIMLPSGKRLSPLATKGGMNTGIEIARFIKNNYPTLKILGFSVHLDKEVYEWFEKNNIPYLKKQSTFPEDLVTTIAAIKENKKIPKKKNNHSVSIILAVIATLSSLITIFVFVSGKASFKDVFFSDGAGSAQQVAPADAPKARAAEH